MTPRERAKRVVDTFYNPKISAAIGDAHRREFLERMITLEIEQACLSDRESSALELGAEVRRMGMAG